MRTPPRCDLGDGIAHLGGENMQWKILPKKSDDLIEQLLFNRGIKNKKDIEQFFNAKLSYFEKDLQIPGIEKSKDRILKAVGKGDLIIVYGDFDVDGICASAILYKALTSIGAKVLPYIPHREKEGYGLSKLGLEYARDLGASVVITVDNGITAIEQAKFAKNIGLDLIITDHHLPDKKTPEAYSIVHSTKMCGAAVAWCLIREIVKREMSQELLQFVAMATVCDLMSLMGLGRAFLVEGLSQLKKTTNLGLLSLISECNLSLKSIGSYEIGHILGPRLNAMGRLEHAIDSLRLLCTKDPQKAKKLSQLLISTNTERQKMTKDALEQAKLQVDKEKNIHILVNKEWSLGIIGLVAGRISEEFYRPAIAISLGKDLSKGSARSIDGINIVEIIRKHKDILVDIGGHPGAAGFSILSEHVEMFKKRLEAEEIEIKEPEQVLKIDWILESGQLNKKLVEQLQRFEPFGFGNPRPNFASLRVQISDLRTVGDGKHLKFKVSPLGHPDPERVERVEGEGSIDCIAFGMGELSDLLQNGQEVDLAYNLEMDTYNGFEKLQLKVKDIKIT